MTTPLAARSTTRVDDTRMLVVIAEQALEISQCQERLWADVKTKDLHDRSRRPWRVRTADTATAAFAFGVKPCIEQCLQRRRGCWPQWHPPSRGSVIIRLRS
jgi:hypothetical protein